MATREKTMAAELTETREPARRPWRCRGGRSWWWPGQKEPRSRTSTVGSSSTSSAASAARTSATVSMPCVEAVHDQVDRYLHQMSERCGFVRAVHRGLHGASLSCVTDNSGPNKSMLVNSGAEAVENAVKIARSYSRSAPGCWSSTGAFHGRTLLAMTMTHKLSLPQGVRAVRAGGLSRSGAVSVSRDHERRCDRGPQAAVQERGRSRHRLPAQC